MLQTFLAVLLALAVRDVFYEILNRYQNYKFRKSMKDLKDYLEDWEADDEEL